MRTFEEAYAASIEQPAFSNADEGYGWTSSWCDRCIHDRSARLDHVAPDPRNNGLIGCPLLAVAMLGDRTPVEWIRSAGADRYHCVEFRDESDGPGEPEPGPPPVVDGQADIFAEFADQIAEQAAAVAVVSS